MPKPIDQINKEFQKEISAHRSSKSFSLLDTNPNGIILPPQYTAAYTKPEHLVQPLTVSKSPIRQGNKGSGPRNRKKRRKTKKIVIWRYIQYLPGILIGLCALVYLLCQIYQ